VKDEQLRRTFFTFLKRDVFKFQWWKILNTDVRNKNQDSRAENRIYSCLWPIRVPQELQRRRAD